MKSINVHEAKTRFSALLADIERHGQPVVICRNGVPVADLIPHRTEVSMAGDELLGAIVLRYEPTEDLSEEEWPLND